MNWKRSLGWEIWGIVALLYLLLFALCSFGQVPPPPPASQAEVNAGTVTTKYVSPATLAGASVGFSTSQSNALNNLIGTINTNQPNTNAYLGVPEIYLFATNAYSVNGMTNTYATCDAMLNAAFNDPSIWKNTNAQFSVSAGAIYLFSGLTYRFETPKVLSFNTNYPATFYAFKGVAGGLSSLWYDGPTNGGSQTSFGILHNSIHIQNGLITVGPTNYDCVSQPKVNFISTDMGYFCGDGSNTMLLVTSYNYCDMERNFSCVTQEVMHGACYSLLQINNVNKAYTSQLFDFETTGDNDLTFEKNLLAGGRTGINFQGDHCTIEDNRIGGFHGAGNGGMGGGIIMAPLDSCHVEYNHLVENDYAIHIEAPLEPLEDGFNGDVSLSYFDIDNGTNYLWDSLADTRYRGATPGLQVKDFTGLNETLKAEDGNQDWYSVNFWETNSGQDFDINFISSGDIAAEGGGNINIIAGTNGNPGLVNIGGPLTTSVNINAPFVLTQGASGNAPGLKGLTGTNVIEATVNVNAQDVSLPLWAGASPGRIVTIQTNAGFKITSFVPLAGQFSSIQLNVSNSSASPFVVQITAAASMYNASSANSITIPSGSMGYIYADCTANLNSTNVADSP